MKPAAAVALVTLLLSTAPVVAHDGPHGEKPKPAAPAQAVPAPPSLTTPEHALLAKFVGTWDAAGKFWMGSPEPVTSKGVDRSVLSGGGLWLVTDYDADFMGSPFWGHGVMGYDPAKKAYVSTWVDSMSTYVATGEGKIDASGALVMSIDMVNENGETVKHREVCRFNADGTRTFTMYSPGPDGKEQRVMEIVYSRRAGRS